MVTNLIYPAHGPDHYIIIETNLIYPAHGLGHYKIMETNLIYPAHGPSHVRIDTGEPIAALDPPGSDPHLQNNPH